MKASTVKFWVDLFKVVVGAVIGYLSNYFV